MRWSMAAESSTRRTRRVTHSSLWMLPIASGAGALLCIIIFLVSSCYRCIWLNGTKEFGIGARGGAFIVFWQPTSPRIPGVQPAVPAGFSMERDAVSLALAWWPERGMNLPLKYVSVPLWIPFTTSVALGLPGGYLWLRSRRRHNEGETCKACGYDLRGLQDKRCPECGTPFDARDERDG